jgi:hypothetical protein
MDEQWLGLLSHFSFCLAGVELLEPSASALGLSFRRN